MWGRTIALSAAIVLGLAAMCLGAAESGKLVELRDGKVEKSQADAWVSLEKGAPVAWGERLRTDMKAVAVVEMPSLGRIFIGPATEVVLGNTPKDFNASLNRGSIWMRAEPGKGGHASVTTTLATAGIRGTMFAVLFDGKSMDVCTCKGIVDVTAPGGGKTLSARSGQKVVVEAGAPMPSKVGWTARMFDEDAKAPDPRFGFCFHCHERGEHTRKYK